MEVIEELWEGLEEETQMEVKRQLEGLLVQLGNVAAGEGSDDLE
jgi:hypothetical protein